MDPAILSEFEFSTVQEILQAIQGYTDHAMYSKESPIDQRVESKGNDRQTDLERLLHPFPVSNKNIRVVLDHVHVNLLGMAKAMLPCTQITQTSLS